MIGMMGISVLHVYPLSACLPVPVYQTPTESAGPACLRRLCGPKSESRHSLALRLRRAAGGPTPAYGPLAYCAAPARRLQEALSFCLQRQCSLSILCLSVCLTRSILVLSGSQAVCPIKPVTLIIMDPTPPGQPSLSRPTPSPAVSHGISLAVTGRLRQPEARARARGPNPGRP